MKQVLFSDLDGTLLDLKSYSYAQSQASVEELKEAGVPIVFCSSKSRVEQEYYRENLGIRDPFIVENGSAIFIPKGYFNFEIPYNTYVTDDFEVITIGKQVGQIREVITQLRKELRLSFACYFDLPAEEVSMYIGLDLKSSRRAMQREFSETILRGKVTNSFHDALAKKGLRSIPGSKFQTIVSSKADKGVAVDILLELYRKESGQVTSIGIGDSNNDFEMLCAVDDAYLVQRPNGIWAEMDDVSIKHASGVGPVGWSKIVQSVLEKMMV